MHEVTHRQIPALVGIFIVAVGLALGVGGTIPLISMLGHWAEDFRIATLLPPEPQHPDIAVIAITEQTLEPFPYRSPVDRRFLAGLLRILEQKGARAIGVDLLFDQATEADKDAEFRSTLLGLSIPVVVSYARTEESLTEGQSRYLDEFLPLPMRGFANLVKDPLDDTVRWIYPGRSLPDGTFVPGLVRALAAKLGVDSPSEETPIAWRGRPDSSTPPFRQFPAQMAAFLPEAWIKDRIILIGGDLSLTDRHRTPFLAALERLQGVIPGVVIHAHALAQILDGRKPPDIGMTGAVAVVVAAALVGLLLGMLEMPLIIRLVSVLGGIVIIWVAGFVVMRYTQTMVPLVTPTISFTFALWMTDLLIGNSERQQKKFIKEAFSHYISPSLVEDLMRDPSRLTLGGERRVMTFLFTDVANFTPLAEQLDPLVLAPLLNIYLDGVCKVILMHDGTVIEFIGDAVFALFSAPLEQGNHAARALECSRDIDTFAEAFRALENRDGVPFGITRIGLHTGVATVGNIGSEERFKYGPVGDSVNTASRIEGLNKFFGTRICVSAVTAEAAEDDNLRPMGRVVLKGKTEALEVYEVLDEEKSASPYVERYRTAYALMDAGRVGEAHPLFEALGREAPDDGCVALHLRRLAEGAVDARIVMTDK
ncbi:MAG: adenylate/guanylate cyclase domain-containing protein [Alphaproteobacteria bacterium]|nr:adenylate/guanylate cyclase domain-containing protein [Alphaproteobacteria bacterium]